MGRPKNLSVPEYSRSTDAHTRGEEFRSILRGALLPHRTNLIELLKSAAHNVVETSPIEVVHLVTWEPKPWHLLCADSWYLAAVLALHLLDDSLHMLETRRNNELSSLHKQPSLHAFRSLSCIREGGQHLAVELSNLHLHVTAQSFL